MSYQHHSCRWRLAVAAACLAGVALAPAPSSAQTEVGLRAGVSSGPDQFHFGGHVDSGPLFEQLSFRPNVEVGVGNGLTTVAVNFEFAYWIPVRARPFRVYAGGGPALNVFRRAAERFGVDSTSTKPGFNLIGGIAHRGGFFAEAKLGLIDSPEAKFTVGYAWR